MAIQVMHLYIKIISHFIDCTIDTTIMSFVILMKIIQDMDKLYALTTGRQ